MMKLPRNNSITHIYYDDRCPTTTGLIRWLDLQPHICAMHFVSYSSAHAEEWFKGLNDDDPERELVVRDAGGDFYRGAKAWVYCLLCCLDHAHIGKQLSVPILMPWARKACHIAACEGITVLRHILSLEGDDYIVEKLRNQCVVDFDMSDFLFDTERIPDGII